MRQAKVFLVACAVVFLLAGAIQVFPRNAAGQVDRSQVAREGTSLETRVARLEQRIAAIEKTVAALGAGGARRIPAIGGGRGWKDISNWRDRLHVGMTKDDVRTLMGEPDKIDQYSVALDQVWHYGYPGGGSITFGRDARVETWSEPAPADRR